MTTPNRQKQIKMGHGSNSCLGIQHLFSKSILQRQAETETNRDRETVKHKKDRDRQRLTAGDRERHLETERGRAKRKHTLIFSSFHLTGSETEHLLSPQDGDHLITPLPLL